MCVTLTDEIGWPNIEIRAAWASGPLQQVDRELI